MIIVDTVGKFKTGEPINQLVSETVVLEKRGGKWLIVALSATGQPITSQLTVRDRAFPPVVITSNE